MHAQAKPAGYKLKSQQSRTGASGPADDAVTEANPDHDSLANPSMADHEGPGYHETHAEQAAGGI